MFLRYLTSLILACLASLCFAQGQSIQGYLIDKQSGKAIPSASILLKSAENKILAFKQTDSKGYFQLHNNAATKASRLEINHLGYKKFSMSLSEDQSNEQSADQSKNQSTNLKDLKIELEQNTTLLDSIMIKSRPAIQRIGDTISYNVDSFANEMDRSIGDVLKKLPGMEVSENGNIKFQGKSISHLYIDGDDLLEDRYNIGTRTIPYKMVKDIQVLQNHEHLKVLKNKKFTDAVALNLVIKDEAKMKMTGEVKLGAGIPKQYDAELNSILFNKKFKVLNVLQGNNIGRDLEQDFTGFNSNSIMGKLGRTAINNLLSLGTVGGPMLGKAHYFLNDHASLNANNLVNLKNEWQLKSNIQLMLGRDENHFEGTNTYLTENEQFILKEIQDKENEQFISSLRFTAGKNSKEKYINNILALEYRQDEGKADILTNTTKNSGSLQEKIKGFSNHFFYIPQTKKANLLELEWYLDYGNKPQTLRLQPGVFADRLNNNLPYYASLQFVEVPTLFSRANLGYRIPTTRIRQSYRLGAILDKQQFNSRLEKEIEGSSMAFPQDSLTNQMDWQRYSLSTEAGYDWEKKRLAVTLNLPIMLQFTHFADPNFDINNKQQQLLFQPTLNAKLRVASEDELSLGIYRSKSFGNIDNVYRGIVLRNYRSLSNNLAGLAEYESRSANLNYKFNRTLQMFFMNAGISYSQNISSNMISTEVGENSTNTQLLDRENQVNSLSSSFGVDKYIFQWASSLKLNASWSMTDYNQLFNQELLPFKQYSYSLRTQVETKIWKNMNLSYSGSASWSDNQALTGDENLDRTSFNFNQSLGLPIYLFRGLTLRFTARHLFNQQQGLKDINYVFLDGFTRYRFAKWKTDLELNMTNLTNIKSFETYSISANSHSHNLYQLRGRMAVLKVIFNFL